MDFGTFRWRRCSISEMAAKTGTVGWQTAITWTSPAKALNEFNDVVDICVEIERARRARHKARIDPLGHIDIVVRQQVPHGSAQQRGEVPRHGRHQQNLGVLSSRTALGRSRWK